jgi:hypothetical protein
MVVPFGSPRETQKAFASFVFPLRLCVKPFVSNIAIYKSIEHENMFIVFFIFPVDHSTCGCANSRADVCEPVEASVSAAA